MRSKEELDFLDRKSGQLFHTYGPSGLGRVKIELPRYALPSVFVCYLRSST